MQFVRCPVPSPLGRTYGTQILDCAKGAVSEVRNIDIVQGEQHVDPEFTRLPGRMNKAAGEDIPKMAVIVGNWDSIEISLAKLGLANIVSGFFGSKVDPDNAGFDMVEAKLPRTSARR